MVRRVGVIGLALVCFGALTGSAPADEDLLLNDVRQRLRAEAGVSEPAAGNADLPMVPILILRGDTHARLAAELTGNEDAERVFRKIDQKLYPGTRIFVPRQLLAPRIADPRLEPVTLSESYPTLWSLAKAATSQGPVAVTVRNLQRLNAIPDPAALPKLAKLLVPRSLLPVEPPVVEADPEAIAERPAEATAEKVAVRSAKKTTETGDARLAKKPSTEKKPTPVAKAKPLKIGADYRVTRLSGLQRRLRPEELPHETQSSLRKKGVWNRQLSRPDVDLVVIHTTEHGEASSESVGSYIQRKRLANYYIGPRGEVYEVVPEAYRAFGCGQSLWEGRYAVDHEAINVEIYANTSPEGARQPITDAQYQGLRSLLGHIRSRRPAIHEGRVVTHRMVALNYALGIRSRKGDPFEFNWAKAGLPDNSRVIDQDVLVGRAKLCTDERYVDRVTPGQTAAARLQGKM